MNEAEDARIRRKVLQRREALFELLHVARVEVLALNVEHINEHFDALEYMLLLRLEKLFHEHILTAAVPQLQHEVAEEADARLRDVVREGDSVDVSRQIICEND